MTKNNKKNLYLGVGLLILFAVWTVFIGVFDVKAIGPNGSSVGFARLNGFFHRLTGANMTLYTLTDWLGLVPIAVAFGFAVLGLCEWIKRKDIKKVDYSLFVLGGFYIVTIFFYLLFESVVINYRPVLINGCLEASYPSSTTLLVLTVMPTAIMQFNSRIKNRLFRKIIAVAITAFIVFMVAGRLISGVHWLTDIIGGALLSFGLSLLYRFFLSFSV